MYTKLSEIQNIDIQSDTLREYIKFKKENSDYVLLFQIGAFFETYFEDAKIFSEITGAQLETRTFKTKIEVLQSGAPRNSINNFIKKLLDNNIKVCLCSEFKTENDGVYREIVRKYTKGTIIEDEFLDSSENNYLLVIYKKNENYLISYADVSTGEIYKTIANGKEYEIEIDKILPNEILISNNQKNIFEKLISKFNTTTIDDKYFQSNIENVIYDYCLFTQKKYKTTLDKIHSYEIQKYMSLDELTRKNLELSKTNHLYKKKGSLLWFLNYTKTPMGLRLLKKYLSEPLLSKDEIIKRLDAVEELVRNKNLIPEIQEILEQFSDLSRLCARLSNMTILPNDMFALSKNTRLLEKFKEIIINLKSDLFKFDIKKIDKILSFADLIKNSIKKDCSQEIKMGNIIEDGYDCELDFIRSELKELYEKIYEYKKCLIKKTKIENLNIIYNTSQGYCIEIPAQENLKVPKDLFQKNSTAKFKRFGSKELSEIEEAINALKYKANMLEYEIFKNIRLKASEFVETIRSLSDEIALIDVITSFAKCAVENNLKRPVIHGNDIEITEGYHPSLIKLNNEIIKNDTNLKLDEMIILTGANMSGKSTYLKHNAIICLLAQIGSFVPANNAMLPIIDKIFFRQNISDDIINNNSSFMVEMNDLKYIIDNITQSSFILLDEPAKSTNANEGGAIARAFCEYLLDNFRTRAIVATHNLELTKIKNKYPDRVINCVMGVNNSRKIKSGVVESSSAIDIAQLAQLPDELLKLAKEYMCDV